MPRPAVNPPTGAAMPHFLYAAAIFVGSKLPRVPVNPPGERLGFGVGRGAVDERGAGIVIPCFTKHARCTVVRFAKRLPPRAPSAAVVGFVIGVNDLALVVGLAVAFAVLLSFGVALLAANDAGAALIRRSDVAINTEEAIEKCRFMGVTQDFNHEN